MAETEGGAAVPGADGERDGRVTAGGGVELPTSGAGRPGPTGAARPLVLPETFDGTGSWSEWCYHFENVAAVNGWDGAQKLQWLRVRVTGRAQKALHRLAVATYEATRDALTARFEPVSRHTRYQAEFQLRRKKSAEGWADFADDLRNLADKAYPTLQEEAKERLSLNSYLAQLPQPQISFSVRQKQPATLDEAVAATIEMESYLPPQSVSGVCPDAAGEVPPLSVESVDSMTKLTQLVGKLTEQVEQLQLRQPPVQGQRAPPWRARRGFRGECWNCHQFGHIARNCPPATPSKSAGKLDTPGTGDQVPGGEQQQVHNPIVISPVVGGYRLPGQVNGVDLTLLLDTGAAVTLLRQDVLARVSTPPPELRPWTGATLVSAGGVPLEILGCSCLSLTMGGHTFQTEFVVVSPLTSDAILGIDFLQALIDLDQGVLRL